MDGLIVLYPGKKDVKRNSYQGPAADPRGFLSKEKTNQQWKNDDSGEDEIDDEDEIPGEPVLGEGRENHRPIRGEKIEDDVTDENRETDLIKTPEIGPP
jgi:hypothetical protein